MSNTPMEGLAEWLRNKALFTEDGHEELNRWADEVEAAQAAMGGKPEAEEVLRELVAIIDNPPTRLGSALFPTIAAEKRRRWEAACRSARALTEKKG